MALPTTKENNVVTALASTVALPPMARVRQLLDKEHIQPEAIPGLVRQELEKLSDRIHPGMRIAITCGSRGVANIALITKSIVDFVKQRGATPFVFPAMGSHGGATAEGQRAVLTGYGVTEEYIGCPIIASMDVVELGVTQEGMRVFADRHACEADGVILCGRVKAHTAFRGPYESGILKMAVIGMGKQHGAEQVHRDGFSELGRLLPMIARVVFDKVNILGALALVENAFDQTCLISGMVKEEIFDKEPELLRYAKTRMGRLLFDDIDVLVVDRLGKDISGDGMDPNIIGRYLVEHMPRDKNIQHIAVLDLTEETHGNCNGIGLADITTRRLVEKIDVDCTFPNVVTSTCLMAPKIPMFTHSDRACIQVALRTCNYIDREHPRVVHIRDTMHLDTIEISESMLEEARAKNDVELLGEPEDWKFDSEGNLW